MELPAESKDTFQEINVSFQRYANLLEDDISASQASIMSTVSEVQYDQDVLVQYDQHEQIPHNKSTSTQSSNKTEDPKPETIQNSKLTWIFVGIAVLCFSLALLTAFITSSKINAGINVSKFIQEIESDGDIINFKKQKGFPPSYSIFASNLERSKDEPVPVILNVPGNGPLNIATAISKCLGYRQISDDINVSM